MHTTHDTAGIGSNARQRHQPTERDAENDVALDLEVEAMSCVYVHAARQRTSLRNFKQKKKNII